MNLPSPLILAFVCPLLFLIVERFQAEKGRPWLTPHLLTDACVGLTNTAIATVFFGSIVFGVQTFVHDRSPVLELGLLDALPSWARFVVFVLAGDFAYYAFHRLTHSTKVLWVFHAVHHAAWRPNPMLQNRGHILEQSLFLVILGILTVVLVAPPSYYFTFVALDQFWDYFQHSDIKVNLGPLKYVLSTPQTHRIHHSLERRHFDKNFGTRLLIWDYLFGTLYPHFDEYPEIGIAGYPVHEQSMSPIEVLGYVAAHFAYPFQALWKHYVQIERTKELPGEANSAA